MLKAIEDKQGLQNSIVTQLTPPAFATNVWRSDWVSAAKYDDLRLVAAANQAFEEDGVVIEQSDSIAPTGDADADYWTRSTSDDLIGGNDGTTISTHPITGVTNYRVAMAALRVGLFARVVVKTGGVDPASFKLRLIGVA